MSDSDPIAWAVMLADGVRIYDVYYFKEEAKAISEAVAGNHGIAPLYRSPTLTDAEREALTLVRRRIIEDYFAGRFPDSAQIAAVIEELLERTK